MAIEKKLIHFGKLADFETQLTAGNILDRSIVFIQDAKKIWTHGTYYDCSESVSPDADNVYIADFTVNDLENAIESESDVVADLTSLEEALAAHKVVLVPYDAGEGFLGYGILVGYAEDLLYFSIYSGGYDSVFYEIEAGRGDTSIRYQNIFKEVWSDKQDKLVSGTNIKTINGSPILGEGDLALATKTAFGDFTDMVYAQAIEGGNLVFALPDCATGDEDDILLSRSTVKTINGESIVGSGDITISGGSSSGGNGAYSEVNHGTADTTFTLTPNTFHIWDEVASLTLDFGSETNGVANEYLFQFTSGATATSLTLPDDIKWADELVIEANRIYQVSILKGLASVLEFNNAPIVLITFYYMSSPYSAEEGMTWEQWCNSTYNSTMLKINGGVLTINGVYDVYDSSEMLVYGTDVIIENEYYDMGSSGGGN